MHRWLFFLLTACLFTCFVSQSGHSSKSQTPKRNIDMSLTFSSEPDTGKECTITFSFTPMEEIDHKSGLDDEANIYFYPEDAIEVISGAPLWSGKLIKGKTETIQIVFRLTRPDDYQFVGEVKSGRVDPKSVYQRPAVNEKLIKAFERAFVYHNFIEKHFLIGERPVMESEYWVVDAHTGKAVKKKAGVDSPFLAPPVRVEEVVTGETGSPVNSIPQSIITQGEPDIKKFGFSIYRNKSWLKKENAYLVGGIRLSMGEHAALWFFETQSVYAIKTDFELIGDCCSIKKAQDDWIELIAEKDRNSCKLIGVYNQTRYLVDISVGDSTLEKVSSDSVQKR